MPPFVSIVLVSWNSWADLARCLPTVFAQNYDHYEVIVVDNNSADSTPTHIQTHYPSIHLIKNTINQGFAAAVNQGFAIAQGEILVELNPDTTVEPDWLIPLVAAFQDPAIGLVTPRILLMSDPTRINACGNEISLTGLTFCIGVGESADHHQTNQFIPAISGAAFAISRPCYAATGGFDSDYFTYFEDTDLSWRAQLAGFDILFAAQSIVYHDYQFRFSPQKMYWIERNRHLTMLKCLHPLTLLCLLPALILGECIVWGYAALQGVPTLWAKCRALFWIMTHTPDIFRRHKAISRLRADKHIVKQMVTRIRFDQALTGADKFNRAIMPLLKFNQQFFYKFIAPLQKSV